MNSKTICILITALVLSSCAGRIQAPENGMANLNKGNSNRDKIAADMSANYTGSGEKFDAAEDEIISKETLKAWRHALAHDDKQQMSESDWQELRKKDEAEAMEMLNILAKAHPNSSYIKTMMGQVKQHFGKKDEAAEFYEEALLQNRQNPILLFKAAEMRRKSGNYQKAREYYERVLKMQADFPGARLGLAQCLLREQASGDKGRKLLEDMAAAGDKEASRLLDSLKSSAIKTAK